ncbi:MAG TPA: hypothetical protein GYA10_00250 [Alphaproteobacteria bacterium]|nr:hypothetical protein [Alphaproteobacteria bacterium]
MNRALVLLAAFAVLPLAAIIPARAEPQPITGAEAIWTADGKVELKVTYQGGACEEPGEAKVEAADTTTDVVVIPTRSTAEICTMQIVPVEYSGVIAVEPWTTTLAITVLAPDGQLKASGSVAIGKPAAATAG